MFKSAYLGAVYVALKSDKGRQKYRWFRVSADDEEFIDAVLVPRRIRKQAYRYFHANSKQS